MSAPIDWSNSALTEVADVLDPHPSHRAPPVSKDGIPFPGIGDFSEDGEIVGPDCRQVDLRVFEEHQARYRIEDGDLGFGRVASIGKVVRLRRDLLPFVVSPTMALVKPCRIDSDYLRHFLRGPTVAGQIQGLLTGTTRSSLGVELLRALRVDYPSERHQQAIAAVLSTIDKAIAQTEALIAKQQRIKTALMQDLLTRGIDEHGNLRSEETHAFKDSPLGRIPVEWDVLPAEELCDRVLDCKNRTPPEHPEGFAVVRTPNVRDGEFVRGDLAFTDAHSYEVWTSRGIPRCGDVVITREAPVGEACQIPNDLGPVCLGQRIMMYQCNEQRLDPRFLVQMLYSPIMRSTLEELAGGSTVAHIRVDDIRTLPIPHPRSIAEQVKVADALASIANSIRVYESQLAKLRRQKAALMQDLLTGKVPVTPLLEAEAPTP